jgi:uncharacterized protein YecE (DUF72 family)
MSPNAGKPYIGTSGYQYEHWRGILYPETLPKHRWFAEYAKHFNSVEINNTFYRLPEAATFDIWRRQAPLGFCYALKFSRYGSHLKRLKDPQQPICRFTERVNHLKSFLGPILVQLPPHWSRNSPRLATFLKTLPSSYRWAVEFRDPSWLCEEIFHLLEDYQVALCVHDMLPEHPQRITTDWIYLRFHGGNPYYGNYSPQFLTNEARRIQDHLQKGRDVYAYFNNDQQGYALKNATDLKCYLQVNQ